MNAPHAPSPWSALRRTRGPLIATAILLGLWLALLLYGTGTLAVHIQWRSVEASLVLGLLGFIVSHVFVGWKLIRLIRAAGRPDMESSPQLAARAFATFWRMNLQAHALLWAWLLLLFILAKLL